MKDEQMAGQLYERFITWVYEKNKHANPYIEGQDVKASDMIDLLRAEHTHASPELINNLRQVVANQMLLALSMLYKMKEYELRKNWIADLIAKTVNAESSDSLLYIINQIVAEIYFGQAE
ncbi:hypothetical protein [Xanthocytophaga agilis]|uniref:Uncharacterized protein n=1 Tax=Xanthocytophaga agilis TaxID=3048010 RepID=A0AAE3R791_9BACT|nr:hypothetical protein [Xanthocytophaga agilis]MDJ1502749.1 hypothetical protein [Xanthocytophaga agilis]